MTAYIKVKSLANTENIIFHKESFARSPSEDEISDNDRNVNEGNHSGVDQRSREKK